MRLNLFVILFVAVGLSLGSCKSGRTTVVPSNSGKSPTIAQRPPDAATDCQKALLKEAYAWLGTPYLYGGHSRKGTDCSGYMMEVYDSALGIKLPRNSAAQSDFCKKVGKDKLMAGDLVFFNINSKSGKINHVGMYVGEGMMIHASSHGVMVSDLSLPYYVKHHAHYGRVQPFAEMVAANSRKKDKGRDKSPKPAVKIETPNIDTPAQTVATPVVTPDSLRNAPQIPLDELIRILDQKADSIYSSGWMD